MSENLKPQRLYKVNGIIGDWGYVQCITIASTEEVAEKKIIRWYNKSGFTFQPVKTTLVETEVIEMI